MSRRVSAAVIGPWPEEINRIVTDRLASLLLTPSRDADANLRAEGRACGEIVFVGNVMIDSLFHAHRRARSSGFRAKLSVSGRRGDSDAAPPIQRG